MTKEEMLQRKDSYKKSKYSDNYILLEECLYDLCVGVDGLIDGAVLTPREYELLRWLGENYGRDVYSRSIGCIRTT